MTAPFWLNDPNILLKKNKITEVWPTANLTFNEKLNAITRLVILLTLVGMFFENKVQLCVTGLVTIMCIVILYKAKTNPKEGFTDKNIYDKIDKNATMPTDKNPVMNVLPTEHVDNPTREAAAPADNKKVEEKINKATIKSIEKNFEDPKISEKLFQDLGDKFTFDRSMRQWHSMPNTEIPNDQTSFADWCYGDMISGKEGDELAMLKVSSSIG